jgi:hypothetical protein
VCVMNFVSTAFSFVCPFVSMSRFHSHILVME